MKVKKFVISPTYKKDNGVWSLNTDKVLPGGTFTPTEQSIIWLPPKQAAGNHRHKRQEALLGLGTDLLFLWQDENGDLHKEAMSTAEELYLFVISSYTPHAVYNASSSSPAILYEYFDDFHRETERVNLTQILESS